MASGRGAAVAAPARSPSPRRSPARAPRREEALRPQSPTRPRRRSRRLFSGSAIVWIVVGGALLAGVVFVNLRDLRLNLRLEQATQDRAQLSARDAVLESELSSELASVRIQRISSSEGLVQANPSTIGYINLGR